jgi:hypothetical protein
MKNQSSENLLYALLITPLPAGRDSKKDYTDLFISVIIFFNPCNQKFL